MNKIIFISVFVLFFILFPVFSFAQGSKFYQLSLNYNKDNIALKSIVVLPGEISQVNLGGSYKIKLLSFSGSVLYQSNFDVQTSIHGEDFDYTTGKVTPRNIDVDNLDFILTIPYFPTGKEIDVYDSKNTKILTIPVQQFAEVTPSPTPAQKFVPTVAKKSGGDNLFLFLGLGVLPLGIGAIAYWHWRSKKKIDN